MIVATWMMSLLLLVLLLYCIFVGVYCGYLKKIDVRTDQQSI